MTIWYAVLTKVPNEEVQPVALFRFEENARYYVKTTYDEKDVQIQPVAVTNASVLPITFGDPVVLK